MTFKSAVQSVSIEARTLNNMKAQVSAMDANVDLFYKIGASRGKNITPLFETAYQKNRVLALRTLFWARDIRGGAGERQLFRDLLVFIEANHPEDLLTVIKLTPEFGRWDDLLVLQGAGKMLAATYIAHALSEKNALAAKWMPRKGKVAADLRKFMELSPKQYRKLLVKTSQIVERSMCAKDWSGINYSHVPSVAAARYQKAFLKNDKDRYVAYREELKKPQEKRDPKVKINAAAVYPYDVIRSVRSGDKDVAQAQWDAMPNYVGEASILPLVDVSGSMHTPVGENKNLMAIDVSLSLGLYLADKNRGSFKDLVLTFSSSPELLYLKGNLLSKMNQLNSQSWAMSTNLHAAFDRILEVALKGAVSQEDMPKYLLILSDMQFNQCVMYDDNAIEMIKRKYGAAGYEMPAVIFWNLNSYDNVPVSHNDKGVALVSGFSPSITRSILAAKNVTPYDVMLETLNNPRYSVIE